MKRFLSLCCMAGVMFTLAGCGFQIGHETPLNEVLGTTEATTEATSEVTATETSIATTEAQTETTEMTSEDSNSAGITSATELDDSTREQLSKLDTDYSKIAWGSTYSIFENYPGVVISVTPFVDYDNTGLVVGITNLYDTPIEVHGSLSALASDDSVVGNAYLYKSCVSAGDTAVEYIHCDSAPDGRILWEDAKMSDSTYKGASWTADYEITGNPADGKINVSYNAQTAGKITDACILLLDSNGYVLAATYDYPDGNAGSLSIYGTPEVLSKTESLAIFINPTMDN